MATNTRSRASTMRLSNSKKDQIALKSETDKGSELNDITNAPISKSECFHNLKCEFDKMRLKTGSPVPDNFIEVEPKSSGGIKRKTQKNVERSKKLKVADNMEINKDRLEINDSASQNNDQTTEDAIKRKTETDLENNRKKLKTDELQIKDDEDVEEEMRYFVAIDSVVGMYYSNIEERINISFQPMCSQNPQMCAKEHRAEDKIPNIAEFYIEKQGLYFITESREFHFIKFVDDLTFRGIFPGVNLISNIFDIILTYDNTENLDQNGEMLKQCSNVLYKILTLFPPCMNGLKEMYYKVLNVTINSKILRSIDVDDDQLGGILMDSISLLDILMDRDDDHESDKKSPNLAKNFLNYYHTWEKYANDYEECKELSRAVKIDRLFFVLNFLVRIMEYDLVIWNMINGEKILENLNSRENQPLIARMMWSAKRSSHRSDGVGALNKNVRTMITAFVKSVLLHFPYDKVKILARFINLIAHTTLMNEYGSTCDNDTIQYPILSFNLTETLAQEIINIATQLHAKSLHLKNTKLHALRMVIENIRTPFIKMLMSGLVLRKVSSVSFDQPFNCEKIYKLISKKYWTRLKKNENLSEIETDLNDKIKYETFIKAVQIPRKGKDIVYENEYIYFLMSAFKCYMNYMRIPDVISQCMGRSKMIENSNDPSTSGIVKIQNTSINNSILVDASLVYRYCEDLKWFNEVSNLLEEQSDEACLELNQYTTYVMSRA